MPGEWIRIIINDVKKENSSRYCVQLKFGYSYLRSKDGVLHSVSDWKMQADTMLRFNTGKSVGDAYDL